MGWADFDNQGELGEIISMYLSQMGSDLEKVTDRRVEKSGRKTYIYAWPDQHIFTLDFWDRGVKHGI